MTEQTSATSLRKIDPATLCALLYGIYAASALMQFAPQTVFVGMIAIVVALAVAYVQRDKRPGSIYESHFHWLIRTFWIGGSVYMPVITLIGATFLYFRMDYTFLVGHLTDDAMSNAEEAERLFWEANGNLILYTSYVSIAPVVLWWLWRTAKGYRHLKRNEAVSNVLSWL